MTVTSFRMVDGRVRNLGAHFERLRLTPDRVRSVRAELRAFGPEPCFPQVTDTAEVLFRPDRPFTEVIRVDPTPHLDERTQPTIKGPDLAWLAARHQESQARGFDEGVLIDKQGLIVEGLFSALIVWRDGPVLSAHPDALPSTTAQQLSRLLPITQDVITVADLSRPMWLLNAFSGVRTTSADYPVTEINRRLWALADKV